MHLQLLHSETVDSVVYSQARQSQRPPKRVVFAVSSLIVPKDALFQKSYRSGLLCFGLAELEKRLLCGACFSMRGGRCCLTVLTNICIGHCDSRTGIFKPVIFSIPRRFSTWSMLQKLMAVPPKPARPVRPMRWIYVSATSGRS